jgi:predicted phage terminase large subunit-like protein
LWPERVGQKELDALKIQMGDYGFAGQMQQTPAPDGGGIINTKKFQLWPHEKPLPYFEHVVQSYDTAFTAKTTGDPTACNVWGVFSNNTNGKMCVMLLDDWAEHMDYPTLRQRVIDDWRSEYGTKHQIGKPRRPDIALVENKGSGQALLTDLATANIYVRSYDLPRGSKAELNKVSRAHIITPIIDAECVFIPESAKNPGKPTSWSEDFIRECQLFPNGAHDDRVDCATQALFYLKDSGWFDLQRAPDDDEEYEVDYSAKSKGRYNPYAQ